jgi:FkbM family methyltransferase
MDKVRSLRARVSSIFKDSSLYERLRNSRVQDLYWRARNPRLLDVRRKQVEFYGDLLRGFRTGDLIFDIGANVGEKTIAFLKLGARVVAVEPDERNQQVLRARFIKYRLSRKPVFIVGKAVSDRITVEQMWVDSPGSALNTLSQKWVDALKADKGCSHPRLDVSEFAGKRNVETTTVEDLTAEYGAPFFVKIDVEGYELSVLRGLRQPVPYLSYEINLPEFRREGLECLEVLRALAPDGACNYASDISRGLSLQEWVHPQELARIIENCRESSIEVFWHTSSLLQAG